MSIETVLYRAQAKATGGRDGHATSSDGVLDVQAQHAARNSVALAAPAPTRNSCSRPAIRPASSVR